MSIKIRAIEIVFPVEVEMLPGMDQVFDRLIDMICTKYEHENPTRTMWPSTHGAKILWREPEEPDFDDSIYRIEVSERGALPKELKRRGLDEIDG